MVAAAVVGSAVVGGVASSVASNKASKAQQGAADSATQAQLEQYYQSREDQMPWLNTGTAALNRLSYLAGLSPSTSGNNAAGTAFGDLQYNANTGQWASDSLRAQAAQGGDFGPNDEARYQALIQQQLAGIQNPVETYQQQTAATNAAANNDPAYGSLTRNFTMADYQADPGYQFRLDQGQQALEHSAAARGGLLSGGALKDTTAYAQGMASQEYGAAYNRFNNDQTNVWNRLSGLAGTGQQASNSLASLGANTANNVAGNMIGAGNAQAAGYVGAGNAFNTALSQGVSGYQNNQLMNLFANRPGAAAPQSIYSSSINGY